MAGQPQIVVGRQVDLVSHWRPGAQRPVQPGVAALPCDVVEPGQRGIPAAGGPGNVGALVIGLYPTAAATATMAEVIAVSSSAVQMYGGIA